MTGTGGRRWAAVLLAAGLLVTGCGSAGEAATSGLPGVFRYGTYPPTSLDPRTSNDLDTRILEPIYDSLITRTPAGKFEPGLATDWQLSADGSQFSLTLRPNVRFQDGAVLDASAVRQNILAMKGPGSARASELAAVSGVDVVDAQHVRLDLSAPDSALVGVLAGEAGMVLSPAVLGRDDAGTNPVGAGPYKVATFTQGEIVYEAWDGYWAKDTVRTRELRFTVNADATTLFRALQSGQLDAQDILETQVAPAEAAGLSVQATPTTSLWQLLINVADPALADLRMRMAISHAIDRAAISGGVFAGTCAPTVQPFGKGFVGHSDALDDSALGYDKSAAERLVSESGARSAPLTLVVSSTAVQQALGAVLQAELAAVGLTVRVEVLDQAALTAKRLKGEFDLALALAPTERPDPTKYVADAYLRDGTDNVGHFDLDGVDQLFRTAQQSTDEAVRGRALAQIVEDVHRAGQPAVPICAKTFHFAFRAGVSGFVGPALNDYDWAAVAVG